MSRRSSLSNGLAPIASADRADRQRMRRALTWAAPTRATRMPASTAGVTGALAPPSKDVEAVVLGDGARAGITGEGDAAGATAGAIAAAGSVAGKGADCRLEADNAAAAGAGAARTE
jgi:hypothetical protein